MSLADELERLERLRQAGSLSEEEFQRAKADLLASNPAPQATMQPAQSIEQQTKQWSMILHFSLMAGLVVPFGGLVVPIVIWMLKKDQLPALRPHWVVVANWLISLLIYGAVSLLLTFVVIGIPMLIALSLAGIAFPIIGGLKATEGVVWKYPLSIPFLKE